MYDVDINGSYFDWMCSLVRDSKPSQRYSYKKLLSYLHSVEFVFVNVMDGNRYEDGINLRYRFGYENGIDDSIIASCLDNYPCSVLEMMVALAFRCEESMMENPNVGMMAGRWFWRMISNLGFEDMFDSRFDESTANSIIWRFLNRAYEYDGRGSLVYIPNCKVDLRNEEIWYQMMFYLSEFVKNGG